MKAQNGPIDELSPEFGLPGLEVVRGVGPDELLLGRPERLCVVGPTLLGHQPVEELLQLGHNPVDEGGQPYLRL